MMLRRITGSPKRLTLLVNHGTQHRVLRLLWTCNSTSTSTNTCTSAINTTSSQSRLDILSNRQHQLHQHPSVRLLHTSSDDFDDFDEDQNNVARVQLNRDDTLDEQAVSFIVVPVGTMHVKDLFLKGNDLLLDLCRSRKDNKIWMQRAEEVLFRLIDEKRFVNQDSTRPAILLQAEIFECVLFGWGKVAGQTVDSMEHMRMLLEQMKTEDELDQALKADQPTRKVLTIAEDLDLTFDQVHNMGCQPTVQTYKVYLVGLQYAANNFPFQVKEEVLSILDEMEFLATTKGYHTIPNTTTYTQILAILSKTKLSVDKEAMDIFRKMKAAYQQALITYETKFGIPYDHSDPNANKHQIVKPDEVTYTTLLTSQAGNTKQVDEIVKELMEDVNVQPDMIAFTAAIDTFAKSVRKEKNPKDRAAMAKKAEEHLWFMVDIVKERNARDAKPQSPSNDDKGNDESENIIDKADAAATPIALTAAPFNAALNAWAQSDVQESAQRAQHILDRMLTEKIVKPDVTSFNTVMNAWSRAIHDTKAPQRVAELINLMYTMVEAKELYKSDRPDKFSFSALIMAWSKSKDPEAAVHAREVLDDQLKAFAAGGYHVKPGIVSFTGVLTAACKAPVAADGLGNDESKDPYRIAIKTYTEILTDTHKLGFKPDHVVFAQMLQAIAKHNDPRSTERQTMTRHVWDAAVAAGECSAVVVRALKVACPNKAFLDLLLGVTHLETVDQLPSDWIRKVNRLPVNRIVKQWKPGGKKKVEGADGKKEYDRQSSPPYKKKNNNDKNKGGS